MVCVRRLAASCCCDRCSSSMRALKAGLSHGIVFPSTQGMGSLRVSRCFRRRGSTATVTSQGRSRLIIAQAEVERPLIDRDRDRGDQHQRDSGDEGPPETAHQALLMLHRRNHRLNAASPRPGARVQAWGAGCEPRSRRPGRAPVGSPSCITTSPATRVAQYPSARCRSRRAPPGRS